MHAGNSGPLRHRFLKLAFAVLMAWLLALLLGCANDHGGGPGPPPPPPPNTTIMQWRIGDAAVDSVTDFELTIASPITLTPSTGSPVMVTLPNNRLELIHRGAKLEALNIGPVPQGTYTAAQFTITNPDLIFVNSVGTPVSVTGSASQTISVTVSPAVVIGSSSGILNLEVNVASALVLNSSGVITGISFTPSSFTLTESPIAAPAAQEDDTGELESVNGLVTSTSGSNFTMNVGQSGSVFTIVTDGTTVFTDGLVGPGSTLNQIVKVEGVTRADNTLFATEVEGLESSNGAEVEGLITSVTGNPAVSFAFLTHDGNGNGMDPSLVGASFVVFVTGVAASRYTIDQGGTDFTGLTVPGPNFPFDPTTLRAGQRVEVDIVSRLPLANGSMLADKLKLQQQVLRGTVSNFVAGSGGAATFDLLLPSDSQVTRLSGQTVVHVFFQPGTDNNFGVISNGMALRVRGLLFWTGTTFNMIARRVTPP